MNYIDPYGLDSWRERTEEHEDCDSDCRDRIEQVAETREAFANALAQERMAASEAERAYGDAIGAYDRVFTEINEAATQMALYGDAGDWTDRADAFGQIVGTDAAVNITASFGALYAASLAEGGMPIAEFIGRMGVARPNGIFGPQGGVIGHPAANGRTWSWLRNGWNRFGWSRHRGGFQLRRGQGERHRDVKGAHVRARDLQ